MTTVISQKDGRPAKRKKVGINSPFNRANIIETIVTGYFPMLLALLIVVLPLLWMAISSFKPGNEIVTTAQTFFPKDPTLENYAHVADRLPIGRLFANSLIVTACSAGIQLIFAVTTAYALVFIPVPYAGAVFLFIMVGLMVPGEAAILPNFITVATLGGRNTLWGIILPTLGSVFGTFLLRQQYKTIPPSLLEAAELDGAGHWRKLWQIVIPISVPTIATVALVTIVGEWNAFLWPLIITSSPDKMTLPVGLNLLNSVEGRVGTFGVLMAGAVLVIAPILILFAALQKYIVAGLTSGAVK